MACKATLRVAAVSADSIVDGPGLRYTVFTQGCPHHCPGCHNPSTHDPSGGDELTAEAILAAMDEDPLLAGLTLSGGEPFCQAQACATLAEQVKQRGRSVVTYSGYTYEQLQIQAQSDPAVQRLLCATDLLVDGPFIESRRNLDLLFRGSDNQRLLQLKDGLIVGELA